MARLSIPWAVENREFDRSRGLEWLAYDLGRWGG